MSEQKQFYESMRNEALIRVKYWQDVAKKWEEAIEHDEDNEVVQPQAPDKEV